MGVIGVVGGGRMGTGIAQVAAANGWDVRLLDIDLATVQKSVRNIAQQIDRLVEKSKLKADEGAAIKNRLSPAGHPQDLASCELIIEAVVEKMETKVQSLSPFKNLCSQDTILATNTSSLSVGELGERLGVASRVCGLHFFNPAPVMPLVEVISGPKTDRLVIDRAIQFVESCGKPVVRCKDTPGFIVNRVARPFYLEALRILEEKIASCEAIDLVMKEVGGFKMGPFELMDLVGIDVNYAVSCSVYERFNKPAKFKPSEIQARLVQQNKLGRKSGVGFYDYRHEKVEIAYRLDVESISLTRRLRDAWQELQKAGKWNIDAETGYVFARILCALMNEAAWAAQEDIASEQDIDVAMKLGTNYPKGLLDWANELGSENVGRFLRSLNATVEDNRFAPAERFSN